MLSLCIQVLFLGSVVLGVLFSVRFLCVPFSAKIRAQISRHRQVHVAGAILSSLWLVFLFYELFPAAWPPVWWERRAQREAVLQRVHSAGGWDALRKDCHALAEKNKAEPVWQWVAPATNDLPPAIAALQPRWVQYYAPKRDSIFNDSAFPVVRITIFGFHLKGGRSTPWMGLDVVCARSGTNYLPRRVRSENPLRYWRYRKVADDVYEFY